MDRKGRAQDLIRQGAGVFSLEGKNAVLREDTFGILSDDGSIDDKILRLLNLLPMAFQVMDEARDTIARLRTELESYENDPSNKGLGRTGRIHALEETVVLDTTSRGCKVCEASDS